MDALLSGLGMYAANCAARMAIRSGVSLTANYTAKQCSRLLKTIDDKGDRTELKKLRKLLNTKINILSPAIDLIEFNAGRGNVFLEPAVPMAKSLRRDIETLGKRLEAAAASEEVISGEPGSRTTGMIEQQHEEMKGIIRDIKSLLARIDSDVHYLQLAITSSGETMSSSMPAGTSPSRFAQSSNLLFIGDCLFASNPTVPVQIGSSFTLSLYMLFVGHHSSRQPQTNGDWKASKLPVTPKTPQSLASKKLQDEEPYGLGEEGRKPIWQEVMHKARIRLVRTPPAWAFDRNKGYCPDYAAGYTSPPSPETTRAAFTAPIEYSYYLEVIENLDDGRLHDEEEEGTKRQQQRFDNIPVAGIRESVPIHQISKIFYTNTGRLLNIGSETENNPVLLLKRDKTAVSPLERRRQWAEEEPAVINGHVEGPRSEESDIDDDDQSEIDRQLFEDSERFDTAREESDAQDTRKWEFPQHLDQEWLALEVYEEDDDDASDSDSDSDDDDNVRGTYNGDSANGTSNKLAIMKAGPHGMPPQVDNRLLEQIRNISICPSPSSSSFSSPQVANRWQHQVNGADGTASLIDSPESFVARSPFGKVASTLSLLEMMIRLTSLQEFQQNSHLAIPDHILNFFLEETSTTGLKGEERWKVRKETKRRVGFDPYTDRTPMKADGGQ
ncbi:RanGTP-binding protein-domain-containing protein [Coniochaeta sp. 2T2.1]|nr:RanGTP-binding protein-domain-containing protein [Coniochaeta sp. 2T2.1]